MTGILISNLYYFHIKYKKNLVLAMDSSSKKQELIERLLEITNKVS